MTRGEFYHYYRPGKPGWDRRWHNVARIAAEFLTLVAILGIPLLIGALASVCEGTCR